jgi:hypothetical protein
LRRAGHGSEDLEPPGGLAALLSVESDDGNRTRITTKEKKKGKLGELEGMVARVIPTLYSLFTLETGESIFF